LLIIHTFGDFYQQSCLYAAKTQNSGSPSAELENRYRNQHREPPQSMESKLRTLTKAITWQALGLATTAALAWFHTGNMVTAMSFALSTAASGLAFFVLHERIWARVRWGIGERHA
jgi:uncharacterized membrane protein